MKFAASGLFLIICNVSSAWAEEAPNTLLFPPADPNYKFGSGHARLCDEACNELINKRFRLTGQGAASISSTVPLTQAIPRVLPEAVPAASTAPEPATESSWTFFGCDGKIKASYVAGTNGAVWYFGNTMDLAKAKNIIQGTLASEALAEQYSGKVLQVAKSLGWRGTVAVTGVTATAFAIRDFFNCK